MSAGYSAWSFAFSWLIASSGSVQSRLPVLITQPQVYSVLYPAEPQILPTETGRTPQRGPAEFRRTLLEMPAEAKANDLYTVLYGTADAQARLLSVSASLQSAAERLDRRMDAVYQQDGKVVSARPLSSPAKGPQRGRAEELVWKDSQGNVAHFRAYYYRELYLVVMVTATKHTYNKPAVDRFMSSFKLL